MLGTPSAATLTIANDDLAGTIEFDQPTYTVDESAGDRDDHAPAHRRSGRRHHGHGLDRGGGTANAPDYTAFTNKVVTFAGGATTASFTVSIFNDTLAEADETVRLQIRVSPPAGIGGRSTATLTIQSEDIAGTVQFSTGNYTVTEGTATAVITVTRTGGTSSGTTVQYRGHRRHRRRRKRHHQGLHAGDGDADLQRQRDGEDVRGEHRERHRDRA